jgi:hypothetical protein
MLSIFFVVIELFYYLHPDSEVSNGSDGNHFEKVTEYHGTYTLEDRKIVAQVADCITDCYFPFSVLRVLFDFIHYM